MACCCHAGERHPAAIEGMLYVGEVLRAPGTVASRHAPGGEGG